MTEAEGGGGTRSAGDVGVRWQREGEQHLGPAACPPQVQEKREGGMKEGEKQMWFGYSRTFIPFVKPFQEFRNLFYY